MGEPPFSGLVQSIIRLESTTVVDGESGVSGTYAARIDVGYE